MRKQPMFQYMAFRCKVNPGHVTAICEIKFDDGKFELALAVPFPVACGRCGAIQLFHGHPVTLIEVPEPIENLPDLPASGELTS